ncbi:Molybdate-binding periplasmic protein [Methylacidimicrobium cyclopophantes]|uniref:Molybdate-binding periplasmic protein n=1 Tax=Methylacidimicrobium cyclopophantes TaxID=1041766 RepID=A0A5E6MQX4_9BACT|nr:molybdate ABC transporter substrate-binding protein [Methylacidimicrobium cyclopophantes]VVM08166.1 Molybdate-binding periplasmic protein [Methylacidimicrobium cyclopophantes]
MRRLLLTLLSPALVFLFLVSRVGADERPAAALRIGAAADLRYALPEAVAAFSRGRADGRIETTYASSGKIYAEILQGAKLDLFLAADREYPERLVEAKMARGEVFVYAHGSVVFWARKEGAVWKAGDALTALRSPDLRRLALANPRVAPYGRAAEEILRRAGLLDELKAKLVFGENVAQAFEFALQGAADACLISRSLALAPPARRAGRFEEFPPESSSSLEQGGVILKDCRRPDLAEAFRDFLLGPDGRELLRRHGL